MTGGTLSSTGSLESTTPGPSVHPGLPLKVKLRSESGTMADSLARIAMCARPDCHRCAAERVGQADAQALAGDAGAHDHADCLIVESARTDRLRSGGRAGGRSGGGCCRGYLGSREPGGTRACAVAQVATQCSWPCLGLHQAERAQLGQNDNGNPSLHHSNFLLRKNYICYQTVAFK